MTRSQVARFALCLGLAVPVLGGGAVAAPSPEPTVEIPDALGPTTEGDDGRG